MTKTRNVRDSILSGCHLNYVRLWSAIKATVVHEDGFISSFHELIQSRGVRRLSVRPSVNFCANRFFSRANGRIVTKLAHDGFQVSVHPGCARGQGQGQRSRDSGTFVQARKSLLLAGKWPDRHQTCTRWTIYRSACTQDVWPRFSRVMTVEFARNFHE